MATLARDILALNEAKEITITSKSAAFAADAQGGDYKVLLLFANSGSGSVNVTIAKGDGPVGAGQDIQFAVAAGKTKGIVVDSGLFKQFALADYKDAYKITPSGAVGVSIIELPQ